VDVGGWKREEVRGVEGVESRYSTIEDRLDVIIWIQESLSGKGNFVMLTTAVRMRSVR
jgi:hypothetical protein